MKWPLSLPDFLKKPVSDIDLGKLIAGALVAIVISSAFSPMIGGFVAHKFHDLNLPPYQGPEMEIQVTDLEGYAVHGEDLEELGGIEYNDSIGIYDVKIVNKGNTPISSTEVNIPFPSCVIESQSGNIEADVKLTDFVTLDLRGQGEGLKELSCSQTIAIDELDPSERISVRYATYREFERCDLAQGVAKENTIRYEYQWSKNGFRFVERGKIGMGLGDKFLEYSPLQYDNITRYGNIDAKGVNYTSVIVGLEKETFPDAMGTCRLTNENQS